MITKATMSLIKITPAEIEEIRNTIATLDSLPAKRTRRQAKHKDADYLESIELNKRDAGKNGGLITGSNHHYDRGYYGCN